MLKIKTNYKLIVTLIFINLNNTSFTYAEDIIKNTDLKLINNNNISINFSTNNRLYGNTGCNNYAGEYKINNNNIKISNPVSTLMYCHGKMDDEFNFLENLEKVNKYKVNNNILELYQNNNLLLRFK